MFCVENEVNELVKELFSNRNGLRGILLCLLQFTVTVNKFRLKQEPISPGPIS